MSLGELGPKSIGRNMGGGMQLIQSYVLTVATTPVIFNNIPQNFNHLQLQMIGQNSTSNSYNKILTNNIASGNYDYQQIEGHSGSSFFGAGVSGDINFGPWPGTSNSTPGISLIHIPCYNQSTFNKIMISDGGTSPEAAANSYHDFFLASNRSTAPITRLDIVCSSGNFIIGSAFYLYGII